MLTILLKECRRRIAWPYSRVLWPPPCAAWGKEEENVSTGQWWPLWEQSSTRILDDKLQRKDALQSSQGIHSRSKWPAYGRGDLWPQPCSIFGRRCVGSDLFSKMAPAWNQQKPTAVLPEKHRNEIGTAYLPLKLLRSIQSEREKQMWCNYSQATEKLLGQAQGHILCLVVFPFKALPPTHLNGSYLPSSHQPEMALKSGLWTSYAETGPSVEGPSRYLCCCTGQLHLAVHSAVAQPRKEGGAREEIATP